MTHRFDIQVRFSDTDALGHVNNAAFARYAELGRLRYLRDFDVAVESLILVHLAIDFRRQILFGEHVEIETLVAEIGRTSVTLEQKIYAHDELAAEVRSVVVHFDYERETAVPVPEDVRAKLELRPEG